MIIYRYEKLQVGPFQCPSQAARVATEFSTEADCTDASSVSWANAIGACFMWSLLTGSVRPKNAPYIHTTGIPTFCERSWSTTRNTGSELRLLNLDVLKFQSWASASMLWMGKHMIDSQTAKHAKFLGEVPAFGTAWSEEAYQTTKKVAVLLEYLIKVKAESNSMEFFLLEKPKNALQRESLQTKLPPPLILPTQPAYQISQAWQSYKAWCSRNRAEDGSAKKYRQRPYDESAQGLANRAASATETWSPWNAWMPLSWDFDAPSDILCFHLYSWFQ